MRPLKAKTKKSAQESHVSPFNLVEPYAPSFVRILAIYYGNENPDQHVHIYDGDGDEVMFRMPGQQEPHVVSLDTPVTVKWPVYYRDEDPAGGHKIILFGETD